MKHLLTTLAFLSTITFTQAGSVTLTAPNSLQSIDGSYYYTWGIAWSLPTGNQLTSATLTYNNIQLKAFGQADPGLLWTHLLDSTTTGVQTKTDNDSPTDAFSGKGLYVGKASFPHLNIPTTLSYNLDLTTLRADLADGKFGIGIDPDCHYTDDSIKLTLNYRPTPQTHVPETGATAILLGSTVSFLALLRRKTAQ